MNPIFHRTPLKISGLLIGAGLLVLAFLLSVALGTMKIGFEAFVQAFTHYDSSSAEHVIIRTTRLPRAVIAMLVGANLAIAGALMQALTRNPLASPSIFGINSGAVFFLVLAMAFLPISSLNQLVWVAFGGAAAAAAAVYVLGSLGRDGLTPLKIVLSGAAMTALFSAFTQGMLVLNESRLQDVLFWLAGSASGRDFRNLMPVLPYMLAAIAAAMVLSRPINILTSGEDIAKGLGQRTGLVKIAVAAAIVILAGSSVSVAGSIGFVGLVVPHIARFLVGVDYRWVVPYSAVLGGLLLLLADLVARFVIMPAEVPLGVMTALIGAPFFIYMARRGLGRKEEAS